MRVSFGLPASQCDVDRFAAFATEFVDLADVPADLRAADGVLDATGRARIVGVLSFLFPPSTSAEQAHEAANSATW